MKASSSAGHGNFSNENYGKIVHYLHESKESERSVHIANKILHLKEFLTFKKCNLPK